MSALRAAGHPAMPRAAHRQERDVREQDAGGAEDAADQDHQHLLSGHAPAGLLHRHQVSDSGTWHSTYVHEENIRLDISIQEDFKRDFEDQILS